MEGSCSIHPNNAAVAVCERCGDFVCHVCRTLIDGRMLCPHCFELLHERGGLKFAQRDFQLPLYALLCSICALFTTWICVGYGLVACALYFSMSALKEINRRPDLPGRRMVIWSIVLTVTAAILGIAFWVGIGFFIWNVENLRRG
jgi:hypothetical protein